uniref:Uncharacterized protein n=1 Tax=Onchocerca volvulus TaxID=6282 RepID=A0A8R1TM90_ONCVO
METITVFFVVAAAVVTVQSDYYANYNDRLGRDFMHFGKRSPNIISQFDGDYAIPKRGEFSRDFMNFGKRSVDDNFADMMIKAGDAPTESLRKKSDFDREFMNFGKRLVPFERNLMNLNKKTGINDDAFNREFLSFG